MIKSIFQPDGPRVKTLPPEALPVSKSRFTWVDVESPDENDFSALEKAFPIHHLAKSAVFDRFIRSKVIEFDEHLFIVFHEPVRGKSSLSFPGLGIFLGKNFLITVHNNRMASIDSVRNSVSEEPEIMKRGPSFLAYLILDHIVDGVFPILDDIEREADALEDYVFLGEGADSLSKIFQLKLKLIELRKRIGPEREVLASLSRHDSVFIDPGITIYFQDIYDHMIRVADLVDVYRELLTGILDIHISVQSRRLNEVMKVLTVIATLMLPLTLVTGFYGMNVVFPEVELFGGNSYFFILLLMVIISVLLIAYFRKKMWL